jgi:DNA-binding response OmpR family regulator
VIFISGYSPDDPLALSLDLRNALYLPKPTSPRALQKAIRALFGPAPAEAAA